MRWNLRKKELEIAAEKDKAKAEHQQIISQQQQETLITMLKEMQQQQQNLQAMLIAQQQQQNEILREVKLVNVTKIVTFLCL